MINYIADYLAAIESGRETVGQWIRLWYAQVIRGIAEGRYVYSEKHARRAIRYIEAYCRHHEGPRAPGKIVLELWEKALVSVIFGILDRDGLRQFREVVIVIARKAGKTLLAAAIASYMTFADGEYGARTYFAAPKLGQAQLCYDAFIQMVQTDPQLSAMAKKRRSDVYIPETNSSAQPIAFSAKKSDGLNLSLGVCDEFASWSGDAGLKFYEVLKSSMGARRQPLLLSISTAGYVNDGVYDELMKRCTAVLLGSSQESRLAPFLYLVDDGEKWDDFTELRKANPNLGVSVSEDYMREEIAIARGSLSKLAEFKTKYCNIKQSSSVAWLPADVVNDAFGPELRLEDFRNCYCVGGIDLSRTTDLTSCCIVVERNGVLYVISKFFMPASRLETASAEDGMPYDIYRRQGILQLSGENYVDYRDCYEWFRSLVRDYKIYPLKVGYDRYSATYLIDDLRRDGYHMDDVYQGYNLSPVIREVEGLLKDRRVNIGGNNLLKAHLLNTALKQDFETQKVKIVKLGTRTRIDGTAALLDAMTVRQKWWSEIGHQLKNEKRGA